MNESSELRRLTFGLLERQERIGWLPELVVAFDGKSYIEAEQGRMKEKSDTSSWKQGRPKSRDDELTPLLEELKDDP